MAKFSLKKSDFKKITRLGVPGIIAAVVLVFFLFLVFIYNSGVGLSNEIGIQEPVFTDIDLSLAPTAVVEDAEKIADELAGNNAENHQKVMDELVGAYLAAKEADIVVFFNSGGMGWNNINNTPGWESILNGITSELKALGYHPLVLNYHRTVKSVWGSVREYIEAACRYPKKVTSEVKRLEFLIKHLPDVKFIIAGESTGTVITEEVMDKFRDNTNVYSLQTGNPFWYRIDVEPRTLRINGNGINLDTFTTGNLPSMIWMTVKGWFGLVSPEDVPGDIMKFLKAPGHHYYWEYESISSNITGWLVDNFPKKS